MKPISQMTLPELADALQKYEFDMLNEQVASRIWELHTEGERRWNNLSVAQKIDALAHPPDPHSSDLIIKNQSKYIANLERELSDLKESTRWIPVSERMPTKQEPTEQNGGWSFDYNGIDDITSEARQIDETVSMENVDAILQVLWKRITSPEGA
jgi:hypothetical protein